MAKISIFGRASPLVFARKTAAGSWSTNTTPRRSTWTAPIAPPSTSNRKEHAMKLYYSDVLMPRKVCAVARYLEAPVEFVFLDLAKREHKSPDYMKLNPNGKVPTLVDGGRVIWEADAILYTLAHKMNSDLWPTDNRQA